MNCRWYQGRSVVFSETTLISSPVVELYWRRMSKCDVISNAATISPLRGVMPMPAEPSGAFCTKS